MIARPVSCEHDELRPCAGPIATDSNLYVRSESLFGVHQERAIVAEFVSRNDGSGELQVSHNARPSIALRVSPYAG